MKELSHTVKDPNGVHARPAGIIVNTAKKFESDIKIIFGDKSGDCKRIFSIMGLSLKKGDVFLIRTDGKDEEDALSALQEVINSTGI